MTERGIFDAIRQGHSYISAEPELLVTARSVSGVEAMVGDVLPAEDAILQVKFNQAHTGDSLRLIVDGKVHATQTVDVSGEISWELPAGTAHWCTVELRDKANDMWALTNPIFFGMPQLR